VLVTDGLSSFYMRVGPTLRLRIDHVDPCKLIYYTYPILIPALPVATHEHICLVISNSVYSSLFDVLTY